MLKSNEHNIKSTVNTIKQWRLEMNNISNARVLRDVEGANHNDIMQGGCQLFIRSGFTLYWPNM